VVWGSNVVWGSSATDATEVSLNGDN